MEKNEIRKGGRKGAGNGKGKYIRKVLNGDAVCRDMNLGRGEPPRGREPTTVRRREYRGRVHVHVAVVHAAAGIVGVVLETHDEAAGGDAASGMVC